MPPSNPPLFSPPHLTYTHTSLAHTPPLRPDARTPTSFRALRAETGLLPGAYGSARVCAADGTEVVVGVRAEVERCAGVWDQGDQGEGDGKRGDRERGEGQRGEGKGERGGEWVEVAVQMQDEGGGPGGGGGGSGTEGMEDVLREAITGDAVLRARLRINHSWRWKIFIDILLLSPPGTYALPLLSLTAHLALRAARLPRPVSAADDDPLFADDWDAAEPLYVAGASGPPVTVLVVAVGGNFFADPGPEEMAVADALVAVSFCGGGRESDGVRIVAVRTLETPGRLAVDVGEAEEALWRRRRGGVSRGVLAGAVKMVVAGGGVGEEVLRGLEAWV